MFNQFIKCFSTAKNTCLLDIMVANKGKIVDFAGNISIIILGYNLPVQFAKGIIK